MVYFIFIGHSYRNISLRTCHGSSAINVMFSSFIESKFVEGGAIPPRWLLARPRSAHTDTHTHTLHHATRRIHHNTTLTPLVGPGSPSAASAVMVEKRWADRGLVSAAYAYLLTKIYDKTFYFNKLIFT